MRRRLPPVLFCLLFCPLALAGPLIAGEEAPEAPSDPNAAPATPAEMVVVEAAKPISAVSQLSIRERDLALRPLPTPEDVLRVVPGLVIGQHAGGGKADQLFVRGFDADHGTDFSVNVDGIPANLVSHAHGQGYADLHWLIPETLVSADTRKGPYFADQGDFGTAGSVNFITRERFDRPAVQVEGGQFATYRILAAGSPEVFGFTSVLAGEAYATDGPFEDPQDLRRFNGFGKLTRKLSGETTLSLGFTAYDGSWNASGQIPERAVESGALDRFGAVDPTEGGDSSRYSLRADWTSTPTASSARQFQLFGVRYTLDLFSNFTFFANDPVNGDGIEQIDDRMFYGAQVSQRWVATRGGMVFETRAGGALRYDDADVSLYHRQERDRLSVINDATVREGSAGIWAEEQVSFNRHLRGVAGLRYDYFEFDVESHLPASASQVQSGEDTETLLQPKASLIVSLPQSTDLFMNYGVGFHSNDARSTVINQSGVTALPEAVGCELGMRTRPEAWKSRVDLALSLWRLDLENEFVYIGDEGGTEVRGPSRRQGVELELRAQLAPWLWADADYSFSRAEFEETGEPVPLAPRHVASGGFTVVTNNGWKGSLRARYLSRRPAIEDESFVTAPYTVLDARLGYVRGPVEIFLNVENLTDADFREAQFYNESRLPSEPVPVPDIHFTPGNPRNVRVGVAYRF